MIHCAKIAEDVHGALERKEMKTEKEVREELAMMLREQEKECNPDTWKHITGYIGALNWILKEDHLKEVIERRGDDIK